MPLKSNQRNEYQCSIEVNQNGKYCVRVRAMYARNGWVLPVYFIASTFDHSMRKLEETLQFLQQKEARLWFWGVEHSDDPQFSGELIQEAGLRLDRRAEFPRRSANVALSPEKRVPAALLAPVRRDLADSIDSGRVSFAGD
ncbi:MAG: hypothetical protein ACRD4Y_16790 [Candidatus Acidiferrales bacterium]